MQSIEFPWDLLAKLLRTCSQNIRFCVWASRHITYGTYKHTIAKMSEIDITKIHTEMRAGGGALPWKPDNAEYVIMF